MLLMAAPPCQIFISRGFLKYAAHYNGLSELCYKMPDLNLAMHCTTDAKDQRYNQHWPCHESVCVNLWRFSEGLDPTPCGTLRQAKESRSDKAGQCELRLKISCRETPRCFPTSGNPHRNLRRKMRGPFCPCTAVSWMSGFPISFQSGTAYS